MNFFIELTDGENRTKLGSDTAAILKNCTLVKVRNRVKAMKQTAKFHNLTHVKISSWTEFYNPATYRQIMHLPITANSFM